MPALSGLSIAHAGVGAAVASGHDDVGPVGGRFWVGDQDVLDGRVAVHPDGQLPVQGADVDGGGGVAFGVAGDAGGGGDADGVGAEPEPAVADLLQFPAGRLYYPPVLLVVLAVRMPFGDLHIVVVGFPDDHVPDEHPGVYFLQFQCGLAQDRLLVGPDVLPRVDEHGDRLGRLAGGGDQVDVVEGEGGVGVHRGRELVPLGVGVRAVCLGEAAVEDQPGDQLVVCLHGNGVADQVALDRLRARRGQVVIHLADRGGGLLLAQVAEDGLLPLDHAELALLSRHRGASCPR